MSLQVAATSMAAWTNRLVLPARLTLLVALFIAAFGIRLYHSQGPPLDFHATRQYRSLLLAREYYFETGDFVPDRERQVAAISAQRQGLLEPPILEHVVALAYRLTGGESMWLPRALSSILWLVGGVWLYRIARRLAGPDAAIVSTAFYLFLPFAVIASTSFQPDSLMIMLILASVLAMVRYDEQPTRRRLWIAAGLSAAAFLVKPMALFLVLCTFAALSIAHRGVRGSVRSPATTLFVLATVLPTLAVYAYGLVSGTFLINEAEKTLLPQLVASDFFWSRWLANVSAVVSLPVLLAALIGSALLRQPRSKALMLGLWIGYVMFCLVVNYNLATHDYYQLQLIPICALGLAPLAALGLRAVNGPAFRPALRRLPWAVLALAIAAAMARSAARPRVSDHEAVIAEQIGALVQHSTRTVYLAADYGVPLEYHGQVSGAAWPIASDLEWERLAGVPQPDAEQRFNMWFAPAAPEYFIVLDVSELDNQPDLKQFLTRDFRLIAQTPDYWLFDLRET
jgi:4-amino-4-deoxy-L-arabinose transferase-like glycosyltransferase